MRLRSSQLREATRRLLNLTVQKSEVVHVLWLKTAAMEQGSFPVTSACVQWLSNSCPDGPRTPVAQDSARQVRSGRMCVVPGHPNPRHPGS